MSESCGTLSAGELPDPLVPTDLNLRDYPSMLLDVLRLRDSTLVMHESEAAFRAAVLLWCPAWPKSPAGSLPNDEAALMHYACVRSTTKWRAIRKGALHGFVEFKDGRLYHSVVCEKAIEAPRPPPRGARGNAHPRRP